MLHLNLKKGKPSEKLTKVLKNSSKPNSWKHGRNSDFNNTNELMKTKILFTHHLPMNILIENKGLCKKFRFQYFITN